MNLLWPGRRLWVLPAVCLSVTACATGGSDAGVAKGRELAHDWRKGNCLACHKIPGDTSAQTSADIGPALTDLRQRYPRAQLRAQIWDARSRNAETVMPPFGANHILTEDEIDKIVEYLYAL